MEKKDQADEGSLLFWERLAEDISTGICEHSSSQRPADLLFRFDKVRLRGSSALISFPTFTLVSSAGGGRGGPSPRQRSYTKEVSKDVPNFLAGVGQRVRRRGKMRTRSSGDEMRGNRRTSELTKMSPQTGFSV